MHSVTLAINCATAHLVVISLLRRLDAIAQVRFHRRLIVISLLLGAKLTCAVVIFLLFHLAPTDFDLAPMDFDFCAEENTVMHKSIR